MPPWTDRVSRLVLGAVLTACTGGVVQAEPVASRCDADSRCQALRNFFLRYQSPLEKLALVFVRTADEHRLDWRLLPAISMVETSGGNHGNRNNVFGWNSGEDTVHLGGSGDFVCGRSGSRTRRSTPGERRWEYWRSTTRRGKGYPPKVTRFMLEISTEPVE